MNDWKRHFSDFGGRAYLDCAAQGPFPRDVSEEIQRQLRLKEHPEEIDPELFERQPERAALAAARLLGCHPSSITFGSGASHGLNAAALGLPLRNGEEVLIGQGEFPAVVLPFLNLAPAGVRVRFVPPGTGRHVSAADYVAAFSPKTRAVAVSLVAFATGYRIDLDALGEACRGRGIFLIVDGAQAIGGIDFRVADHPVDVLAVSGYKWLFGPYGTGLTYVSPRVLDRMRVAVVNWQTVEGAAQLNRPFDYALRFREGACRYDAPQRASFLNLGGFAASMEFLARVRVSTVEAHAMRLLDRLLLGLGSTVLKAASDLALERRSTILGLEAESMDATRRVWRRLVDAGVLVSLRANLIRVSPNIYNTTDDIDRLLKAASR
ncbi:MAG TPA: aminotransferase class V-fold PLP-dependent enzyme [Candidatus Polarisedimenticolia bacterium]|nr:aminotransferase class V-fold PLP-dependent enzyme [Candidatus Polarisedimenticolia bacterium]